MSETKPNFTPGPWKPTCNMRSSELADDLKCRISSAVREWLRANDVQLEDPMWASFGARSQECLEVLIVGRLNDCCDDIAGDFLGSV